MAKDSNVDSPPSDASNDTNTEQPGTAGPENKADGEQLAPRLGSADANALRSSLRESTSRLQFAETGDWTTEDLENIE